MAYSDANARSELSSGLQVTGPSTHCSWADWSEKVSSARGIRAGALCERSYSGTLARVLSKGTASLSSESMP